MWSNVPIGTWVLNVLPIKVYSFLYLNSLSLSLSLSLSFSLSHVHTLTHTHNFCRVSCFLQWYVECRYAEWCYAECHCYNKMMFLVLSQVCYWRFKCNTHNNYNYIIKTNWNYNWKLFTAEHRSTKQSRLGFGIDRAS